MKTFLIIAERPKHVDEDGAIDAWCEFLSRAKPFFPQGKGSDQLPEGLWQLPVDTSLHTLAQLLPLAGKYHIDLRLLLLDEPPAWIKYTPPTG